MAVVECYSDIACPFAYLAIYRLRRIWPEFESRVTMKWRALSLEYINQATINKPLIAAEVALLRQIEPGLPLADWTRPDWEWPATSWPAFELLAAAQAQSDLAAFDLSWALRKALFAESRCLSLRHELFAVARQLSNLDHDRLEADWDSGRYKDTVIADSRRGWHAIPVEGSPTFVLPSGERVSDLACGDIDFDEEQAILRRYVPYPGDPLAVFREMLKKSEE